MGFKLKVDKYVDATAVDIKMASLIVCTAVYKIFPDGNQRRCALLDIAILSWSEVVGKFMSGILEIAATHTAAAEEQRERFCR